jgi:hypothetical protein
MASELDDTCMLGVEVSISAPRQSSMLDDKRAQRMKPRQENSHIKRGDLIASCNFAACITSFVLLLRDSKRS